MIQIDKQSRVPVYEQIVEKLEKLVLSNILQANDQLPTVRNWSEELGVNPNTLQKAYLFLDQKGVTYSVPGVGRFVSETARSVLEANNHKYLEELYELVMKLAFAGEEKDKVIETVENVYEHVAKKLMKERGRMND